MTTVIIDCLEQKVYTDTCVTSTRFHAPARTFFGVLFNVDHKAHVNAVYREHKAVKMQRGNLGTQGIGDFIMVGTGDYDLLKEFFSVYPQTCDIVLKVPQRTRILVVQKRGAGVIIDEYCVVEKPSSFFHKKCYHWSVDSYLKPDGYLCMGSGGHYAWAALKCGKTPGEAIVIASQCDEGTNEIIEMETL
jgi:hypothetical protein